MARAAKKTGRGRAEVAEAAARPGRRGRVPELVPPLRPVRKTKAAREARLEAEAAAAEQAAAAAALAADPPPKKRRVRKADKSVLQPKDKTPDGEGSEDDDLEAQAADLERRAGELRAAKAAPKARNPMVPGDGDVVMDISNDTSVDGLRPGREIELWRELEKVPQAEALGEALLRLIARYFAGAGVGLAQATPIFTFFAQQELTSVQLLGDLSEGDLPKNWSVGRTTAIRGLVKRAQRVVSEEDGVARGRATR
jgi:hypothetical protein